MGVEGKRVLVIGGRNRTRYAEAALREGAGVVLACRNAEQPWCFATNTAVNDYQTRGCGKLRAGERKVKRR
jgi:NAD(P)-dependent dehydrogenase (short-subunit alcohol dehydrogenase family)